MNAVVQLLTDGEFPPPPWPGTNLLRPITSRAQLHRIGAELRNCLEAPTWLTRSVLTTFTSGEAAERRCCGSSGFRMSGGTWSKLKG